MGEVERLITPIAHDPRLPALDKFLRLFDMIARWKTARKPFFINLLRVWYADENAIVRDKFRVARTALLVPLLTAIITQGVEEGVFTTPYPDQVAGIILALMDDVSENFARLLLAFGPKGGDLQPAMRAVAAYTDAIERVLGAPKDSLCLVDPHTIEEWFLAPRDST